MSGGLVTREMPRGAPGPIVRDEESTDGHRNPNATPWFAFLDIWVQMAVQGC